MKKVVPLILAAAYIPVVYLLFFHSCAPAIRFDVSRSEAGTKPRIFISAIRDDRPPNERIGYDIIYIRSISDNDYPGGFTGEFRKGLRRSLEHTVDLVDSGDAADVTMTVTVHHFYGEYFRSVEAALVEFGSALFLFLPRFVTDAVPYNAFAGRVAMEIRLTGKDGRETGTVIDEKVTGRVSTYRRGSRDTAARLCGAASPKLNALISALR